MASTMLQRTQSGTETDSKKATISVWVKLGSSHVGNFNAGIFGTHVSGNYGADGNSQIGWYNGGLYAWFKDGGSTYYKQESTRRFRDHTAWYHLVYRFDMTESTASDRIRVYVNGEEITSFASSNNPGTTQNIQMNNGGRIVRVGTYNFLNGTANNFDGCMSHFHFCDGYSYAPTEFGETDSTTGEWKIKTSPSVNYGTNGFLILKDGNTITDQSSNSNSFSVGSGTLTKTEDNPSNIFATLNPLYTFDSALSYTKGNTVVAYSGSGADDWTTRYAISSLGMVSGKYYAETKIAAIGTNQMYVMGIISDPSANAVNSSFGYLSNAYAYYCADGRIISGASDLQTGIGTATTNDIVGLAFDADNGTMQLYKNGSAIGSQVTGISVGDRTWHFASDFYSTGKIAWNFGNGYFEETAVSSAGTNASNIGIFEYDVPSGYTALCTKGLNE